VDYDKNAGPEGVELHFVGTAGYARIMAKQEDVTIIKLDKLEAAGATTGDRNQALL
jgi:hypothetical protein